MNKPHILTTAIVLLMHLLSGCASGISDLQKFAALYQPDPRRYEAIMREFITKARNDDIDGMLAITSNITIKAGGGKEKLRELYKRDTMPALKRFTDMLPTGESGYGPDKYGNLGWRFKRIFRTADGNQAKFEFSILSENDRLVVAYFGLWQ